MNSDELHKPQDNSSRPIKRGRRSLDSIDTVLSKFANSLGLDKRLKEHALLSLWPLMIGEVFADKSRPLFLDYEGNLVIAVKDASVAQELSLLKPAIISKMRMAAQSMNLKVTGMRFDLKHYYGGTPAVSEGDRFQAHKQPRRTEPTPEELAEITLSESDLQELAALQKELPPQSSQNVDILKNFNVVPKFGESKCLKTPGASPNAKKESDSSHKDKHLDLNQRIVSMFEQELKLRQWRRKQGFPLCPKCKLPTQSLHGAESICSDCYFAALAQARDI
jgi:Dna[CI] antecedent, DciA